MKAYVSDPDFTLYVGDVREVLRELSDASVDCCVTSPPYWGLRDYGADGQIGLERTPELFVAEMVAVFREVRRVLANHGTCWLNLGDSYNAHPGGGGDRGGRALNATQGTGDQPQYVKGHGLSKVKSLKPKDLVGIPWRVALALQDDGWWLRSDIVWSKPNPMPEAVTDRPTKSHEYVFLLTKSSRYFFDQEAVRERAEWARWGDQTNRKHEGSDSSAGWIGAKSKDELQKRATPTWDERKAAGATRGNVAFGENIGAGTQRGVHGEGVSHDLGDPARGRNIRSVWEIATQPYPDAHFATFPEALPERCIKAGCPEFVCATCGKARERITSVEYVKSPVHGAGSVVGRHEASGQNNYDGAKMPRLDKQVTTDGWTDCGHGDYRVGVVLDPFIGSGTTALVARKLGRKSIGIELNESYAALAAKRLQQLSLLAEEPAA